ncbi:MAG: serine/threonine-protein phosphatase [Armatimonadetes bacterium]|nr:serine/threonine-protein phosphatase [Armatimonadota bacterium]
MSTGQPRPRDTLLESEGVVALFRTLLVAVVLVAPTAANAPVSGAGFYLIVAVAGLYCLLATLPIYKRLRLPFLRPLLLTTDILLLTVLIHNQGGVRGGLFPLYYLTVVIGAMWFSMPGAVGAAALATLLYIAGLWFSSEPDRIYYLLRYEVLTQVLLLHLTAILCAYLAEAWHAERRQAEESRQIVAQFARQIDMAQELQTLILPPTLPLVAGLEVGVRTRQAAVVVGGDYYDGIAFSDGTLGLCCADVSGKSVPGQLRLPLVKYALRVCAAQFQEPQAVVQQLNRLLYDELPPEMFVSLVYVLVEPSSGRVRLAGKHCPPLQLVARTGQVVEVPLRGVVLGLEPDLKYEVVEIELAPDDYLLLYTDGAIEAKDRRDRELEVSGLLKLLSEATPESAQDLANWLFQAIEEHEVGAKHDDLTLVVLRRTAQTR